MPPATAALLAVLATADRPCGVTTSEPTPISSPDASAPSRMVDVGGLNAIGQRCGNGVNKALPFARLQTRGNRAKLRPGLLYGRTV